MGNATARTGTDGGRAQAARPSARGSASSRGAAASHADGAAAVGGSGSARADGATAGRTASHGVPAKLRVAFLGFACPLAWAFLINAAGGSAPDRQEPWIIAYGVLTVATVLFGFIASRRPAFLSGRRAGAAAAAVGAASSLLLGLSYAQPGLAAAQVAASIACACVLGWLYLQWGLFYAAIDTRFAVTCLFLANIVASLIKLVAHVLPVGGAIAIAALLPIASVVSCRMALASKPPARMPHIHFERGNLPGLAKVGAAVAAFSFSTAFLIGRTMGNQSAISIEGFAFARLLEIVICLIVLAVVVGLNKAFNFSQLWRIVLLVLAVDILCAGVFPQITLLRCIESSAWDLVVLFAWITIADIARHAKIPAPLVFGVGWTAYTFSFTVGMALAQAVAPLGSLRAQSMVALMFLLVITGSFCLEQRDQDTKWIFAELRGEPASEPSDQRSLDERCAAVARAGGLTPRELDIMKLLVRGRTKAYIAETLYLTENTVKGHAKHIYTKLDVHSKQELMDLVETADR